MDDFLRFIAWAWPKAVLLAPGVWALYLHFDGKKKVAGKARADLIQIAQEAAGEVIETLREETDRLRGRVDELEAELRDLHRTHTNMIADKDAKIALLEGEKRQLEELLASALRLLDRHGIPRPVQSQPYWEVADGELVPAAAPTVADPTT